MEFEQKGFFKIKIYRITNNGVEITEKSMFNYHEYSIDFTDFTTKRIVKKESSSSILFFVFMFTLATVVILISALVDANKGFGSTYIFLFFTLAFLFLALMTKKKVVILPTYYGSKNLEIAFNSSSEKRAKEFADKLIDESKKYLITKFTKVDKDLPKDSQLENLVSLRDRDLIDDTEFIRLKNILLDKEDDSKIGFS